MFFDNAGARWQTSSILRLMIARSSSTVASLLKRFAARSRDLSAAGMRLKKAVIGFCVLLIVYKAGTAFFEFTSHGEEASRHAVRFKENGSALYLGTEQS